MTPEEKYISETSDTHRKDNSQYFTPEPIARLMCEWVHCEGTPEKPVSQEILDPAWGLGMFARTYNKMYPKNDDVIVGFEKDMTIFDEALEYLPENSTMMGMDYLEHEWEPEQYDAVIANPPYLNSHEFNSKEANERLKEELGVSLNQRANLYCYFLIKAIHECHGKYAFVIPSEFLNTKYGEEVKQWLIDQGSVQHIILLDGNHFPGAITTTCIILGDHCYDGVDLTFHIYDDRTEDIDVAFRERLGSHRYKENYGCLDAKIKWKTYYDRSQFSKLHEGKMSKYCTAKRGLVTGNNKFFLTSLNKARQKKLDKYVAPILAHAYDIDGFFFDQASIDALDEKNKEIRVYDFYNLYCRNDEDIPENAYEPHEYDRGGPFPCGNLDPNAEDYLEAGEAAGIGKTYVCAQRDTWWRLEYRETTNLFLACMVRGRLKPIYGKETYSYALNSFLMLYPTKKSKIDSDGLLCAIDDRKLFPYLLSGVAEKLILSNARDYGNGLKVITPKDFENAPCIELLDVSADDWMLVDNAYRNIISHFPNGHEVEARLKDYREFVDPIFGKYL